MSVVGTIVHHQLFTLFANEFHFSTVRVSPFSAVSQSVQVQLLVTFNMRAQLPKKMILKAKVFKAEFINFTIITYLDTKYVYYRKLFC